MSSDQKQLEQYVDFLKSEDLSFGIEDRSLRYIVSETLASKSCRALMEDSNANQSGLGSSHLLRIRRAVYRYETFYDSSRKNHSLWSDTEKIMAERFAHRTAQTPKHIPALQSAFTTLSAFAQKHGRIRIHLKQPEKARHLQLDHLADHTEGCQDIPPHRWFAAARGVSDNALWMEVLCPQEEVKKALGRLTTQAYTEELTRSIAKPVLDHIAKRSERQVIRTAAESLYALMSKAPINSPVAGLATDAKHIYVKIVGDRIDNEHVQFSTNDFQGVRDWLHRRRIEHAAVVRLTRNVTVAPLMQFLAQHGMVVEPAREAGLMKQAKQIPGSIKFAAAEVAARRFRDPLEGFAGLESDQLGLGEYLDRVDPLRLKKALEDARDIAAWERDHGKKQSPSARGISGASVLTDIEDLRPGMEMTGTVSNLTHFGAFVELGFAVQGLVHLSELSDHFIKHPSEVVQPGDRVRVKIVAVDQATQRISLSMRMERPAKAKKPLEKRKAALQALDKLFGK